MPYQPPRPLDAAHAAAGRRHGSDRLQVRRLRQHHAEDPSGERQGTADVVQVPLRAGNEHVR